MATYNLGSINYTKLKEAAENKHSSFSRAKDGTVYVNIVQWLNDEPDKFGNTSSIQLSSSKEKRESEGKVYIGNLKDGASRNASNNSNDSDDLPF